ncbi:MAG TPA: 7TM diverse intracellular signaling domain-containing protein [Oligoflexus sp.]|uniref:7TM diverse intracellular signaling domain-containing protein n=1 Tax=Oligoflexus sp. TaxID=1971216 RepID=UPI002D6B1AA5|nr:7TM diverse intracellular signaling domain-containing protein [Oligoflexus sp.]HYX36077.1 7TM diverse intracellular signaling domain-containing protein [Oligoflexus sp.]
MLPEAVSFTVPGPDVNSSRNFAKWGTLLIELRGLEAIPYKLGMNFRADTAMRMLILEDTPGASFKEVSTLGKVSSDPSHSIPQVADQTWMLPQVHSPSVYLVIHISGWHYHNWSVWRQPVVDNYEKMNRQLHFTMLSDVFICGMLSIMLLYFASLYIYRRADYASLWLATIILAILCRQIGTSGPLLGFAVQEPAFWIYAVIRKLEYVPLVWPAYCGVGFVIASFHIRIPPKFLMIDGILATLLTVYSLFCPLDKIARFAQVSYVYIILHLLLGMVLSLYSAKRQKTGSIPMLVGSSIIICTVLYDIAMVLGWHTMSEINLTPYGVVGLLFCQGQILAIQFSKTFKGNVHALRQLKKVVYSHQLEHIKNGQQLESTMPTHQANACVLSFDIIGSSNIRHIKSKVVFRRVFERCNETITSGYNGVELKAKAYRIKEMGDGFLCSMGYPFASLTDNPACEAIELAFKFAQILREEFEPLHMMTPVVCGIGIALDAISGFYPESGAKEYDLYGPAIILATRYESMRKTLFPEVKDRSIIIIQEIIFQSLDPIYRLKFIKIDLREAGITVRDDPAATALYYHFVETGDRADHEPTPLLQAS